MWLTNHSTDERNRKIQLHSKILTNCWLCPADFSHLHHLGRLLNYLASLRWVTRKLWNWLPNILREVVSFSLCSGSQDNNLVSIILHRHLVLLGWFLRIRLAVEGLRCATYAFLMEKHLLALSWFQSLKLDHVVTLTLTVKASDSTPASLYFLHYGLRMGDTTSDIDSANWSVYFIAHSLCFLSSMLFMRVKWSRLQASELLGTRLLRRLR